MHAITLKDFGGPEMMIWAEIPAPTPGAGEVLIRTIAVGLNRADLLQRAGHYPPPPGTSELLGLECSGVVEALGDGVEGIEVGQQVVALLAGGAYAEYVVAPAGQVAPIPAGIDPVSAAGVIEVAATVLSNLDLTHLTGGETFLVHGGAGGIGSFAIQYAKVLGARVATTASASKLNHCRAMGADLVFNYDSDWVSQLKQATDGHGADVILDIIGAKYLDQNISALAADGRLVIIGMQKGTKAELNIAKLLNKRGTISATSLRYRPDAQKTEITKAVVDRVWPMLTDGVIRLSPETRIPLTEAARAHELLASGSNIGKVILTL